ncbi:MAG: YiiD C-terminal domain-containing protein [Wenzhouxiangella sp.]
MPNNIDAADPHAERAWLEPLLRERIPLAGVMALEIARLDAAGIGLDFPLAPSVNDKGSAFGGALASAMILAGWSLPRLLLRRRALTAELVIGRCELRFLKPVLGAYSAVCDWPDPARQLAFLDGTRTRAKGRLDLDARIVYDGEVAATLQARYAALVAKNG